MISTNPLEHEIALGPLSKVDRAKKHVNDLNWVIADYLAASPFKLRIRESINPDKRLVYVEAHPTIPENLALILGDAVHNLRTALDHLCFGMVGDKAKNPRGVGFPFVDRQESLSGAITTRQMHLAPENVLNELHALQPYPSGNKYLHAVKALDERDKHHFIVTVGTCLEFTVAELESLIGPGKVGHLPPMAKVSTVGDFLVHLEEGSVTDPSDKEADFQPPFTIGFGEGEPLVSQPVIPALKEMTSATEDAIFRLARAFVG